MNVLSLIFFTSSVLAWNTLYSYTDGRIYLHLSNNDLVGLNFSINGYSKMSDSELESQYLKTGQSIQALASPPANSTLFLAGDELFGINEGASSSSDICGDGSLNVIKYDAGKDSWQDDGSLNFNDISDSSFYQYSTVLTSPSDNKTVFIYGGLCGNTGDVSNRMLSLNLSSMKLSNISTSTKPQPFYGAANLLAPNPQTQLVIGGQSNQGWLNMYQLATWDFSSGWSFKQVSDTSGNKAINARKFALTLPIFKSLPDNSINTITDQLSVAEILLIGGQVSNKPSVPSFSKLILETNAWTWNSSAKADLNLDQFLGAATIFNTLVVVNSTSETNKRDDRYTINLYDVDSFEPVQDLQKNIALLEKAKNNSGNSHYKSEVQKKAILGTVLPISALVILAVGFFGFRRYKQKKDSQDEVSEIDYQFGNYFDANSMKTFNIEHLTPSPPKKLHTRQPVMANNNDTNSTLDNASFDSWIKKREEFDQTRVREARNSYLASNETLSSDVTEETPREYLQPTRPQPTPAQINLNLVNRSVSILKNTFSFTGTPPTTSDGRFYEPMNKTKGRRLISKVIDDDEDEDNVFSDKQSPSQEFKKDEYDDEQVSDSNTSFDDKMDVQVLVSSKRRTILKVINPDVHSESGGDENPFNSDDDSNIRQRIPSGAKLLE